jgi:hypothetical protein
MMLPTTGEYHVNVYFQGQGQQISDVMTCGTLKLDR